MAKLLDEEIRTREVLGWTGIHVFHAPMSSCSQKLRMFLAIKQPWTSHPIDVLHGENLTEYFLGINPRGLIPAIVIDGQVHIESNEIILMLEQRFPTPALIPRAGSQDIAALLRHEDELHLDLRTISFRFMVRPSQPPRSLAELDAYGRDGPGTIAGEADTSKTREVAFWRQFHNGGISDEAACKSVARFGAAFTELDEQLRGQEFLLGDEITVLDLAWVVYLQRLLLCGYPIRRRYPRLWAWYARLSGRPPIWRELVAGGARPEMENAPGEPSELEQLCGL